MRSGAFVRFLFVVGGAAILAGPFAGTAAADHRDSGYHQESVYPKATYPRGDHLSRGRHGGGHRNLGYVVSVVAVPIIVAPPIIYPAKYPYYVQQPYPVYRYVPPPPVPTYLSVDAWSASHTKATK
jgi:hypothetical protein